jgi:site-specific DNA recombinase
MPKTKAKTKAVYTGPRRALVYTRVSSEEQAQEGTSLDVQRERAMAYCTAQGWDLVEVFTDAGISGALPEEKRPALMALMAAVDAGKADVVVVAKVDRLARSMRHLGPVLGRLDDAEVALVSIAEAFDSASPAGRLMRNMLGSMAEWERDVIRERTTSGRIARLKDGGWAGGEAPMGFAVQHDSDGRRPRLVIHEAEAKMVRRAVSLLLDEGKTTGEVADILNSEGYTPRKAPRWHAALLRNHLMRGSWGGTWTYAKPSGRTKTEPMTVAIPRMLDAERHAQLLTYLKATSLPKVRTHVHPLSGLLIGACGHHYTGVARRDRGHRRYRCAMSKNMGREDGWRCDGPSVLADTIDNLVWSRTVNLLRDPDSLRAAATEHLDLLDASTESIAEALGRAKAKVVECETLLKNAFTKAAKGGLPEHLLNDVLAEYRTDLAQAEQRVADLAVMQVDEAANADRMAQVNQVIDLAQDVLVDADPALRATVLRLLDVRVVLQEVTPEGSPMRWAFMGQIAHGSLVSLLTGGVPGSAGHLSFAKRTSR